MTTRARRTGSDDPVLTRLTRISVLMGSALHEERQRRRLSIRALAARAGVGVGTVHGVENGGSASLEMYLRLSHALGTELSFEVVGPDRRLRHASDLDLVHATMGELEASALRRGDVRVGIDEPWQHYQFSGRADLLAWDVGRRSMLHLENRTQFPDVQDAIGRYNTKRGHLAGAIRERLGMDRPPLVRTHVMVALWSSEVIRAIRRHPATFRAACPDPLDAFLAWWHGGVMARGSTSSLVVFDPFATGRQRRFVGLDAVLGGVRPRVIGYAEAAGRIRSRGP